MATKELGGQVDASVNVDRWIGSAPSGLQIVAFMTIGTIALIIAGVQPLLLGALVDEHRLSAAALGWTVTTEFLAMGVGVTLAGTFFPPTQIRLRGVAAAAALFAMDILITHQSGLGILASRAVAGLAEGVLGWTVSLMFTRSPTPARFNGIFLVSQGVAQIAFAAVLPFTLMKTLGANGGFYALAGTAVLAAMLVLLIPDKMAPLPVAALKPGERRAKLSGAGIVSLVAVMLLYAFFIGFFAYFTQLAGQAHLSAEQSGFALAAALGTSIIGSGAAAALAKRVSYYGVYLICMPVNLLVLGVLATMPSPPVFIAIGALYGFFWGFFMPFQLPLVIKADPTRRTGLLVPGAKALGAAVGPLLCSFFVTDLDARGALLIPGACLVASFAIATVIRLRPAPALLQSEPAAI
jgi:hypothetical protein